MRLSDIKIGSRCKIINIQNNKALKYKFMDFGIKKDTEILVEHISISKSNITVKVKNYTVALRDYESATLEVSAL
ncbi:MAG: ferrous iron transport protein A [Sulfurimonas sp.]|nr:ferrous iron transport protein A [Sulfurimonas sp.]